MTRVVLDTNLLVSSVIKTGGNEASVLDVVAAGAAQACVSYEILDEYLEVLWRPKLRLDPTRLVWTLELIRQSSFVVRPTTRLSECPDEPDNGFLECADAASADFLITGNKRHVPAQWKSTRVVNAREFLVAIRT